MSYLILFNEEFNVAFVDVSDGIQWGFDKIATKKGGNKVSISLEGHFQNFKHQQVI